MRKTVGHIKMVESLVLSASITFSLLLGFPVESPISLNKRLMWRSFDLNAEFFRQMLT